MAFAVEITLGTGNKVSLNYQSQEVSVSITYQLERGDTDVLAVVQEKAAEVAQAHHQAWQAVRDEKTAGKTGAASIRGRKEKTRGQAPPTAGRAETEGEDERNTVAPDTDALTIPPQEAVEDRREQDSPDAAPLNGHTNGHAQSAAYDPCDPFAEEALGTATNGVNGEDVGEAEPSNPSPKSKLEGKASPAQIRALLTLCRRAGVTQPMLQDQLDATWANVALDTLTVSQAAEMILKLTRQERERFKKEREKEKPKPKNDEELNGSY